MDSACGVRTSTLNLDWVFYYREQEAVGVYVDVPIDEMVFLMIRKVAKHIYEAVGH